MDSAEKSCESLNDDSKPEEEDARQCNPSLPLEMEIDTDKIRGDAIGNTLYSECWVLKVLLKLSKFNSECWSEDVETELCLLWDMTIEPDVVELLMEHNFLELASHVIRETTVPRLTEILVGIVGNICCVPSVRKKLALRGDLIRSLLGLLSLPDVPTLLQLIRLIQTCAWDLRNSESNSSESSKDQEGLKVDSCVEKDVGHDFKVDTSVAELQNKCEEIVNISEKKGQNVEHQGPTQSTSKNCMLERNDCEANVVKSSSDDQSSQKGQEQPLDVTENLWLQELMDVNKWLPNIIFILNSSTNEELLRSVLSLMDTLCYIPVGSSFLGNYIASPALVMALIETLEQLDREYGNDDGIYPDENLMRATCHWVSVLSAFTSFPEGRAALGNHARAVNAGLCRHLWLEQMDDPLTEDQAQFIMLAVTVVGALLLDVGYFHPKTFNRLLAILSELRRKLYDRNETTEEDSNSNSCSNRDIEKEVVDSLDQYFEAVVQWADQDLLNHVLRGCDLKLSTILESKIRDHQSSE